MILLHGFPECWYGWRYQIEALAEAGYQVVIPDQRGYNLSQKPKEVESYRINLLKDDVIEIIKYFHKEKAIIIGHDWGGLVAWHLASSQPEFVDKLIVINSPHPSVMLKLSNFFPVQWIKNFYLLFFQVPLLPEVILQANHFHIARKVLELTSEKGTFPHEELERYCHSWSRPGALTAMLNWYRAMCRGTIAQVDHSLIQLPVQIIWGKRDVFLSIKLGKESLKMCTNGQLTITDATHWVHLEQPEMINRLVIDFLNHKVNCFG
jgi:pimeloyl-ACP methyl ester carboxylesterase